MIKRDDERTPLINKKDTPMNLKCYRTGELTSGACGIATASFTTSALYVLVPALGKVAPYLLGGTAGCAVTTTGLWLTFFFNKKLNEQEQKQNLNMNLNVPPPSFGMTK